MDLVHIVPGRSDCTINFEPIHKLEKENLQGAEANENEEHIQKKCKEKSRIIQKKLRQWITCEDT